MASASKGSCWFLMMFFKLLLTPHSSRRQRTLTWERLLFSFVCVCGWDRGLFMGSFTQRGDREECLRGEQRVGWRGRLIQQSLPKQKSFSLFSKFLLTTPASSFFLPFPFPRTLFHARQFPQIWGLIPIFPPSASEWNLISPRSTPANLALMLQSDLRLLPLSYLSTEWNSSVILKSLPLNQI